MLVQPKPNADVDKNGFLATLNSRFAKGAFPRRVATNARIAYHLKIRSTFDFAINLYSSLRFASYVIDDIPGLFVSQILFE